jgi:hypothetical protein
MGNNPEMSNNPEAPPEWFDETYSDPQNSGEADGAVQQQLFESTPDDSDRRVVNYIGSLMELGILEGDSQEQGQEYLQAAEDIKRVTDIENRVRWEEQEMTIQDVYFLRKYDSETQNFGYDRDHRIDQLLQDRDPEADLDMMLENFDQTKLAQDLLESSDSGRRTLADNLDKFPPEAVNHTKLAHRLMNRGVYNVEVLARNLDKFPPEAVDHAELVRDMMDRGWESMSTLVANLDRVPEGTVDHAEIARELRNKGWEHILAQNLDKFQPEAVDEFQLARYLLESGHRGRKTLAENLDKFQFMAVDQAQLARDLMRSGMERILAKNLDKFPEGAIDHAREVMDSRGEHSLARNLDKLREVPTDVRD